MCSSAIRVSPIISQGNRVFWVVMFSPLLFTIWNPSYPTHVLDYTAASFPGVSHSCSLIAHGPSYHMRFSNTRYSVTRFLSAGQFPYPDVGVGLPKASPVAGRCTGLPHMSYISRLCRRKSRSPRQEEGSADKPAPNRSEQGREPSFCYQI